MRPGPKRSPASCHDLDSYFLTRLTRLTRWTRETRETRVAASVLPDSFLSLAAGAFGEIFLSATIVTSPPSLWPSGRDPREHHGARVTPRVCRASPLRT